MQRSQTRLNELRAQYEEGMSLLTERKVARMALQKEEDAARAEHTRLSRERAHTMRALEENQAALVRAAAQETALRAQLEELLSGLGAEQTQVNERKEQQHALEEERQRRQQVLSEARAQKDELNARARELEERKHKQELATKPSGSLNLRPCANACAQIMSLVRGALPLRRSLEALRLLMAH